MTVNKLHRFHLSYKLSGEVQLVWIEALNLRHAKEKILFSLEEVTDIRDWTLESKGDLDKYLKKSGNGILKTA